MKNKGFSLVETVVYLGLLIVLLVAIIDSTVLLAKNYRNVKAVRSIENSAISSMDRMVREIRNAKSIDGAQTTYNSSPGSLKLNTTDTSGTAQTLRFYLSGGKVIMERNGISIGQLTTSNAVVSSLIFRAISTSTSDAIKIEISIESGTTTSYVTKNFYETAILRNSY